MPLIEISRLEFDFAEPWSAPSGATSIDLVDARTGHPPRLPTRVTLWRDDTSLFALFAGQDRELISTYLRRDEPLWEEDVVEIFLSPERPEEYYEIEINGIGTIFDARVLSPDGHRRSMRVDPSWDCANLQTAVRREPGRCLEVLSIAPFAGLGRKTPRAGERWRANFYRIDRSADRGDEFSAWSPTMKTPPDFHVPAAFGEILF